MATLAHIDKWFLRIQYALSFIAIVVCCLIVMMIAGRIAGLLALIAAAGAYSFGRFDAGCEAMVKGWSKWQK